MTQIEYSLIGQLGELPLGEGEGAKHSPPGGGHAT